MSEHMNPAGPTAVFTTQHGSSPSPLSSPLQVGQGCVPGGSQRLGGCGLSPALPYRPQTPRVSNGPWGHGHRPTGEREGGGIPK